jgi:RHS repeat-associated protein
MCCPLAKTQKIPQSTPYSGVFLREKNARRETLAIFDFTGKELDQETGFYYYGARYLNPKTSMWISVDPAMGDYIPSAPVDDEARKRNGNLPGMGGVYNYVNFHVYHYAGNNPVKLVDPDGRSPNKAQVAVLGFFIDSMNTSPSRVGTHRGIVADATLQSFANTEGLIPEPTTTPYFNNRIGRYVYTTRGGWIDMVHFLFYAGEARKQRVADTENPVGEAVQKGFQQEFFDSLTSVHSAYSYEDLPSDRFGAIFGATIFDPNSERTLAEQIQDYLVEELGATSPLRAPNWRDLPAADSRNPPDAINTTTTPMYTIE